MNSTFRQLLVKGELKRTLTQMPASLSHSGRSTAWRCLGRWFDPDAETWRDGQAREVGWIDFPDYSAQLWQTRIVLAAHLDHDPTNNQARNLKAICQRCHLLHDRGEHHRRRRLTYRRRRALGDLFEGVYPRW